MIKLFENELIAAPFTPMTPNAEVNLEAIPAYVDHLLRKGIKSVFICGTTGESTSLSIAERKQIAEKWIESAQGQLKVMVHIGGCSLPEGKSLVKHAASIGATAVSAFAPNFIKAANAKDLAYYFKELLEEEPSIPFYYYNMPSMTNVQLPVLSLLKEIDGLIPNFYGVKYTHNDLMDMLSCANYKDGKYEIMNGFDEILLAGLSMGATGAVGSTYNYIPEVYQTLMEALKNNNQGLARQQQLKSIEVVDLLIKYGGIRTGKALMSYVGVDCGSVRRPLEAFTSEELRELHTAFDKIFQ